MRCSVMEDEIVSLHELAKRLLTFKSFISAISHFAEILCGALNTDHL